MGRLKALREAEERRAELEDDEMLFTYSRDDASQVKKRSVKVLREKRPVLSTRPIDDMQDFTDDTNLSQNYVPVEKRKVPKKAAVSKKPVSKSKSVAESLNDFSDDDSLTENISSKVGKIKEDVKITKRSRGRGRGTTGKESKNIVGKQAKKQINDDKCVEGKKGRGRGKKIKQIPSENDTHKNIAVSHNDYDDDDDDDILPVSSDQLEEIEVNEIFSSIAEDGSFLLDDLNTSDLLSGNDNLFNNSLWASQSSANKSLNEVCDTSLSRNKRQPKRTFSDDFCWEPLTGRPRKSSKDADDSIGHSSANISSTVMIQEMPKRTCAVTISSSSLSATKSGNYMIRHTFLPSTSNRSVIQDMRGNASSAGSVTVAQPQLPLQLSALRISGANVVLTQSPVAVQRPSLPRQPINLVSWPRVVNSVSIVGTQATSNNLPIMLTNNRAPSTRPVQVLQQQQSLVRGRLSVPTIRTVGQRLPVISAGSPRLSISSASNVAGTTLIVSSPRLVSSTPQSVLVNNGQGRGRGIIRQVATTVRPAQSLGTASSTQYILASPSSLQDRNIFLSFVQQPQTVVLRTQPNHIVSNTLPLQSNAGTQQVNVVYQPTAAMRAPVHSVPILEKMALQLQGVNAYVQNSGVQFVQIVSPTPPRTG